MFLENKDDIAKLRECFAGLWSLDDSDAVENAIRQPGAYVMKPQREGGGNNIYGDDVKETLLRLQKDGSEEEAAYILMQRINNSCKRRYRLQRTCYIRTWNIQCLFKKQKNSN